MDDGDAKVSGVGPVLYTINNLLLILYLYDPIRGWIVDEISVVVGLNVVCRDLLGSIVKRIGISLGCCWRMAWSCSGESRTGQC